MAHLPQGIEAFQNTSIPTLQVEDSSVDLVSCFSVFTHVENFDTAWIMEIKRILRPGGMAWITFLSERHWTEIKDGMPRYKNWYGHAEFAARRRDGQTRFNRLVFRQRGDKSYFSIVFYNTEFLRRRWGRILDVLEVRPSFSTAQDVVVMQKTRSP
jgi:SAM-dependent methyltransferase